MSICKKILIKSLKKLLTSGFKCSIIIDNSKKELVRILQLIMLNIKNILKERMDIWAA